LLSVQTFMALQRVFGFLGETKESRLRPRWMPVYYTYCNYFPKLI
jgi:hypothetical protein